jgi:hypothetical protein
MVIIFLYGIDIVDSQGSAVVYTAAEYFKSISIIPVQPIVSAKPHKAVVILANTDNRIVGQALFYTEAPDRYVFGEEDMAVTNKKKVIWY